MRLTTYLNEAIKKRSKFAFAVKKDKTSFYNNPEMVGHRWAIEKVDLIEAMLNKNATSPKQKLLASALFAYDTKEWHYFVNTISKKYINSCSYVLKRANKATPYELYNWYSMKSGLMKTELTHMLEYLSYISKDNEQYFNSYSKAMSFYGLKAGESRERFDKYHKKLETYDYIKFLKSNWR